jgi:hypothetical protein
VAGVSVAFLRCSLAQAHIPALRCLNIALHCNCDHLDEFEIEVKDEDNDECRHEANHVFEFLPFQGQGAKTLLQGLEDGPVLRKDVWRSTQEVLISFKSKYHVIVRDATMFLELFGGLENNPALKIGDVTLDG